MEKAIEKLGVMEKQLLAMNILEEYTVDEIARLLAYNPRKIRRLLAEALDQLAGILVEGGILGCQEGRNHKCQLSCSKRGQYKGIKYLDSPSDFCYILVMEDAMKPEPTSLQEAIVYFSNPDNCIDYLAIRRWPNGKVTCPGCGSEKVSQFNPKRRTWKCGSHHPKREFSIKVGTIYEDSPIPLDKWLTATWMLTNCKNGVSSYEIARDVKVSQKAAWFMLQRIRLAMQDEFFGTKIGGPEQRWKLTKHSSAARRGTCTRRSAVVSVTVSECKVVTARP